MELSFVIELLGLRVNTELSDASVNSVDFDAVRLFVFIGNFVLSETLDCL